MSILIKEFNTSLKSKWAYELLGALLIVTGLLVFTYSEYSYADLTIYFAVTFYFSGIFRLSTAISNREYMKNWVLYAIGGCIDVLLGSFLLYNFGLEAFAIANYVGFFLLFTSFSVIVKSFDLKALQIDIWAKMLAGGIAGVALSAILIALPILGAGTLVLWTGLGFIVGGILYVTLGLKLHKASKFIGSELRV